ncbi:MAG: L-threonylcarbamoyladenylate synthase [Sphaerochaeta sp.]|jgi:L-threonylcarbamoyladenylate synthase
MKKRLFISPSLTKAHPDSFVRVEQTHDLLFLGDEEVQDGDLVLQEGYQLRFWTHLPHRQREQLSLLFHTLDEALVFLAAHPDPAGEYPILIQEYGKLLREGKLVAFPTETVYGLGADATDERAARAIFTAKERPLFDPLIVHVATLGQLEGVVASLDERAKLLIEHFWPGPLTLVVEKHPSLPSIITADGDTVAIRMPASPLALSLIEESGKPIAAPSANRFGYTSPTTAAHVQQQLGERIAAILDGGSSSVGIESTVLSLAGDTPKILRPGKIGAEELYPIIGPVSAGQDGPTTLLESPGLLENHYAPTTPLVLVDDVSVYAHDPQVGVLLFERSEETFKGPVRYISEDEDPNEAASRLYWAMRELDGLGLKMMVCTLLAEKGIGIAINNRLRKASFKG